MDSDTGVRVIVGRDIEYESLKSLLVNIIDEVRHKEWCRREAMHTAFEAPVCGPKHEGGRFDTRIESVRSMKSLVEVGLTLSVALGFFQNADILGVYARCRICRDLTEFRYRYTDVELKAPQKLG